MSHQIDTKRRKIILGALSSSLLLLAGCAASKNKKPPPPPKPIIVDVSNVKDIPSLILAIKKAGSKVLPKDLPDELFYKEFAEKFIANAKTAIDQGYKIPEWIIEKLPLDRKVVIPASGLVVFTLAGALFAVPLDVIFIAVLGSILLMYTTLSAALDDENENKKYKPRI